jgi:hypothetical protein
MVTSPQKVALVVFLALIPAGLFTALKDPIAGVTLVNVALIAGSLILALSPHEHDEGHGNGADHEEPRAADHGGV